MQLPTDVSARSWFLQRFTHMLLMRLMQSAGMQVGLRHFESHTLNLLDAALRSGGRTRHVLACELCERTRWLNTLGFGSATWRLRARVECFGWSDDARADVIERVVCHRFLLSPRARVHPLAFQLLRMIAREVADHWNVRYTAELGDPCA